MGRRKKNTITDVILDKKKAADKKAMDEAAEVAAQMAAEMASEKGMPESVEQEFLLRSGGAVSSGDETDPESEAMDADDFEEIFNPHILEEVPQKRLCFCHPDCFANRGHVCMALRDTRFKGAYCGGNCPFYKTEGQYVTDRMNVMKKLFDEGKAQILYQNMKEMEDWELAYMEELTKRGLLGELVDIGVDLKEMLQEASDLEDQVDAMDTSMSDDGFFDDSDIFGDDEEDADADMDTGIDFTEEA